MRAWVLGFGLGNMVEEVGRFEGDEDVVRFEVYSSLSKIRLGLEGSRYAPVWMTWHSVCR